MPAVHKYPDLPKSPNKGEIILGILLKFKVFFLIKGYWKVCVFRVCVDP